jgi:murein L,D-transpeptidase YcbB/YkuD
VNIPQMNLSVFSKDSPVFYMRTVVGRASRPTPVIDAAMKHVVVSPPWTVPPTILEKDVLPGVLRRGGGYLARKGLKALDGNGKPIDPSMITMANYKRFSYTQKPGYNSSLGEIKFNMPNSESVYMHDTPHREDFPKANRALSSGCVRVHKPKEFARFVLNDSVKYSFTKIDSMCKERKTKYIPIGKPMQVYFAYLTAGVDSTGHFMYPADIYSWDPFRP